MILSFSVVELNKTEGKRIEVEGYKKWAWSQVPVYSSSLNEIDSANILHHLNFTAI